MKTRWAIAISLGVTMLAACSASSPSGYGATPPVPASSHRALRQSWMASSATNTTLIYVADIGTNEVYAYSYSTGELLGELTGFAQPWGLCTDAKGDLFVTDHLAQQIYEYAHGGAKPLKKLKDTNFQPGGCAVDARTGNLAVANVTTVGSEPGNVAIYKRAAGKPVIRKDKFVDIYQYCGFDDKGNLYVDGQKSGTFAFAELPFGKSAFINITLQSPPQFGGSVQWNGGVIAVRDYTANFINEYTVSGRTGTLSGQTPLTGSSYAVQVWIDGTTVVGANATGGSVMYWNFPAGGAPTNTITGLVEPWGITVSP